MKKSILFAFALMMGAGSMTMKAENEIYAVLNETKDVLTIRYDDQRVANSGVTDWTIYNTDTYHYPERNNNKVTSIVLDESMKTARPTSTKYWFDYFKFVEEIENLDYLNTSEVTDMSGMFIGCEKLKAVDLSNFNTAKVTKMGEMFRYCSELTELDLSHFNTSAVTNMNNLFTNCEKLIEVDVRGFDLSSAEMMYEVFANCYKLETIHCNSDWSGTTAFVMDDMFIGDEKLVGGNGTTYDAEKIDASYARPDDPENGKPGYFTKDTPKDYALYDEANTTLTIYYGDDYYIRGGKLDWKINDDAVPHSDVTVIELDESMKDARPTTTIGWFYYYPNLREFRHLEYLNTSEVTQMNAMFYDCGMKTLDLRSFNVEKVTSFYNMFYNCSGLQTIYCDEDWSATSANTEGMFTACFNLVGNNGTACDGKSHINGEYARPDDPKNGKPGYFTSESTQGLENVQRDNVPCTKVMENGVPYIMYKGTKYNVQGAQVK